jgi:hypothetical protein
MPTLSLRPALGSPLRYLLLFALLVLCVPFLHLPWGAPAGNAVLPAAISLGQSPLPGRECP